jgi:hypothetical protein
MINRHMNTSWNVSKFQNLPVHQGCGITMPDSGLFAGGQVDFQVAVICRQVNF